MCWEHSWLWCHYVLGTLLVVVALCIGNIVGCGGIMLWGHCWLLWHYVLGTLLVVVALCVENIAVGTLFIGAFVCCGGIIYWGIVCCGGINNLRYCLLWRHY